MKLSNLLSGTRVFYDDGEIKVIKDFTWGTYIVVGGLTQSGGIVNKIWKEVLKKVLEKKPVVQNVLILGFGGGTAAKLVSQYWVGSKITGIDIDSKIVELGKKYLGLKNKNMKIEIVDAMDFVKNEKKQYDLIIVDLYQGDKFPEKFEKIEFINDIKKVLIFDGIVVFNRLYGTNNRPSSMKFGRALEKQFKKVDYIFPQANVDFICYN
ncbi:hypothetical protein BH10PAT1_BH10PAT1_2710 [soil metagenome]